MWVLDSVFLLGFWVIVFSILLLVYCYNHCCGPGILFIVILYCRIICLCTRVIMASRKRSKSAAGSSSSQPAYDADVFVSLAAFNRFNLVNDKNIIQDRGMEYKEDYRHDPQYAEVKRQIVERGWEKFVDVPKRTNESLMKEFLANWPERDGDKVYVRKK